MSETLAPYTTNWWKGNARNSKKTKTLEPNGNIKEEREKVVSKQKTSFNRIIKQKKRMKEGELRYQCRGTGPGGNDRVLGKVMKVYEC